METLKAPEILPPAGTSDVYTRDAMLVGMLNRDADELLALKERVAALEQRLEALEGV